MRKYIAKILQKQVTRYLTQYKPKVIVVTGSVGKTSTTQAVATMLRQKYMVRSTIANYNTDVGVPCSFFGHDLPKTINNPIAWGWIILKNIVLSRIKLDFSVVVLELGTDRPGEIAEFAYLKPEIAVVTAVVPEHMEFFGALEEVAKEELSVAEYSEKTYVNKQMVPAEYLHFAKSTEIYNYGRDDYKSAGINAHKLNVVGQHSLDAISAGVIVGRELGMSDEELQRGASHVSPQKGRMQLLQGINGSTLVDDTYNSSPEAVFAALDYLYVTKSPQKIALLGNMNELGETSEAEHRRIGEYCDSTQLELVVTLGEDANKFTAESAKAKGCAVAEANSPQEAAEIIKHQLKNGGLVLLKGSQNGVYAEEATKILLANPKDRSKLVRQSPQWMNIKAKNFNRAEA